MSNNISHIEMLLSSVFSITKETLEKHQDNDVVIIKCLDVLKTLTEQTTHLSNQSK